VAVVTVRSLSGFCDSIEVEEAVEDIEATDAAVLASSARFGQGLTVSKRGLACADLKARIDARALASLIIPCIN